MDPDTVLHTATLTLVAIANLAGITALALFITGGGRE